MCFTCERLLHGSQGCLEKEKQKGISNYDEEHFGVWLRANTVGRKRDTQVNNKGYGREEKMGGNEGNNKKRQTKNVRGRKSASGAY